MGRFDAMNLAGWLGGFAFGIAILGLIQDNQLSVAFLPYVFVLGAVTLLAGFLFAWYLVRIVPRILPAPGFPVGQVLRNAFRRSVLLVTLPWLIVYMLIGYVLVFVGTASAGVGFPDIYLAAGIGGGGALLVISQPRFGRLADRYGRTRMMNIGVAGFVGVMVTASLLVAFGPLPELLAGLVICVLAALAYGPAALAALADLAFALSRGTTMAIYSLTISLGMILGLVLGTQLVDRFGNDGYYLFFGGIAVALVAISAFRYWEVRLGPPAQPTTLRLNDDVPQDRVGLLKGVRDLVDRRLDLVGRQSVVEVDPQREKRVVPARGPLIGGPAPWRHERRAPRRRGWCGPPRGRGPDRSGARDFRASRRSP